MTWGNPESGIEYFRAGVLSPIAFIYGLGNGLHRFAFDSGIKPRNKISVPVISVGNITCGGTGKSTIVTSVVRFLLARGLKVGVLSRGYRRKSTSQITVVSDGEGSFSTVAEAGDEPLMIAKANERAVVLSGADRWRAGLRAVDHFGCEVLVLDDGFQHYSLSRDLDIVLVDYNDLPDKDSLLPAGRLREPLSGLKRASQIVITKIPKDFNPHRLENLKRFIGNRAPDADISSCRFAIKSLRSYESKESKSLSPDALKGAKVVTFCGLARPQGFLSQVRSLGANIVANRNFPDHHWYSLQDMNALQAELKRCSADFFVTTEKDFVKVQTLPVESKTIVVELETEWLNDFPQQLQSFIDKKFPNKLIAAPVFELEKNRAPTR